MACIFYYICNKEYNCLQGLYGLYKGNIRKSTRYRNIGFTGRMWEETWN